MYLHNLSDILFRYQNVYQCGLNKMISATNQLLPSSNYHCVCRGDVVTYTCTSMGGGSTQWEGSAFDCPSSMNEIILRHSQYTRGTSDTCNNGEIVGKSVDVRGSSYTSQLIVTVGRDLSHNVTIQCIHNADQGQINVGVSSLVTVSGTLKCMFRLLL